MIVFILESYKKSSNLQQSSQDIQISNHTNINPSQQSQQTYNSNSSNASYENSTQSSHILSTASISYPSTTNALVTFPASDAGSSNPSLTSSGLSYTTPSLLTETSSGLSSSSSVTSSCQLFTINKPGGVLQLDVNSSSNSRSAAADMSRSCHVPVSRSEPDESEYCPPSSNIVSAINRTTFTNSISHDSSSLPAKKELITRVTSCYIDTTASHQLTGAVQNVQNAGTAGDAAKIEAASEGSSQVVDGVSVGGEPAKFKVPEGFFGTL